MRRRVAGSILTLVWLNLSDARLNKRELQIPTRWDDCMGMTGAECEEYILSTLGGDLDNHPIPDLKVKFSPQRTPNELSDSYWMFGVPTNIFGEVDCDLHRGKSVFPFDWKGNDGNSYTIPDVECAGLDALACCDAVEQMMIDEGLPLTNSDGKCFSCWVNQQPLKPYLSDATGYEVVYVEHMWDSDTQTCVETTLSKEQVVQNDRSIFSSLKEIQASIKHILEDPNALVSCGYIKSVRRDVLLYGRAYPRAVSLISGLLCGQCEGADTEKITLTLEQHEALQIVNLQFDNFISSDQNCIIIYTDHTGEKVLKVPQIGGSRNDALADDPDPSVCSNLTQPDGMGGCMCPAIQDISGNQAYWMGDSDGKGYCECPRALIEFDDKCFCQGGYKVWDPVSFTCVCPHGTNDDGSCVCPGPFSGLDWNNVGWIKDTAGDSCKIDVDCTQSGYDYYGTFEGGCDLCKYGSYDDGNGNCITLCDEENYYFYYEDSSSCLCPPNMCDLNGKCQCKFNFQRFYPDIGDCACPVGDDDCRVSSEPPNEIEIGLYGYGYGYCWDGVRPVP